MHGARVVCNQLIWLGRLGFNTGQIALESQGRRFVGNNRPPLSNNNDPTEGLRTRSLVTHGDIVPSSGDASAIHVVVSLHKPRSMDLMRSKVSSVNANSVAMVVPALNLPEWRKRSRLRFLPSSWQRPCQRCDEVFRSIPSWGFVRRSSRSS